MTSLNKEIISGTNMANNDLYENGIIINDDVFMGYYNNDSLVKEDIRRQRATKYDFIPKEIREEMDIILDRFTSNGTRTSRKIFLQHTKKRALISFMEYLLAKDISWPSDTVPYTTARDILKTQSNLYRYARYVVKHDKIHDISVRHILMFRRFLNKVIKEQHDEEDIYVTPKTWYIDGIPFSTSDFSKLVEHCSKRTIRQSGIKEFPNEMIAEYSNRLKKMLMASKLVKVNSHLNIVQLSLCIVQMVTSIVDIFIHGAVMTKIVALILSITQLLVAIGAVTVGLLTVDLNHAIISSLTEMLQKYFGLDISGSIKQASMPSIDTIIAAVCGMLGVAIAGASLFKAGWASSFQKNVIQSNNFRKALKESVTDSKAFVEEVAETCFGVKISPLSKTFDAVIEVSDEVSKWLQKPDTYLVSHPRELAKFAHALQRAETTYTSFRIKPSTLESRYANALNLLFQNIISAKGRLDHLRRLRTGERVKQEPPCYHFVGRPGAGKTTWINTWLIPKIQQAMGWDPQKYVIDFGAQPEFWPPYLGEAVAFFDEFLAMKDKDPIVPHLNRICSTEHNIIPGANTYTKEQECLFKVLLLGSNTHYENFGNVLTTEAARAMYSRLTRIEIVNASCPPEDDYDRKIIKHSPDFSELEFRRYLRPSGKHSSNAKCMTPPGVDTTALDDPYTILSKEQVLDLIIKDILKKEKEYLKFRSQEKIEEKDSMGYLIPDKPEVLENKPVLRNLLDVQNIEKPPSVSRPQQIVMRVGEEDYTREMLERYIETTILDLRYAKYISFTFKMQRFLNQLENIKYSDRVEFVTVLEKIREPLEELVPRMPNPIYNRINTLFTQYGVTILPKKVRYPIKVETNTEIPSKTTVARLVCEVQSDEEEDYEEGGVGNASQRKGAGQIKEVSPVEVVGEETEESEVEEDPETEITIQQASGEDQYVVYIDGPPGTGKSTLAETLGMELGKLFSMPVVSVKYQELKEIIVTRSSVIILHDKVVKQERYCHWYDTLPSNCIILNTNNFVAQHHTSYVNLLYGVTSYYTIPGSEQVPGYARRSGLPGYVYHGKQWAYTNIKNRKRIHVPLFTRYEVNGKISTLRTIKEQIFQDYVTMTNDTGSPMIREVEQLQEPFNPDLIIKSNSLETLKHKVTNVRELLKAKLHPSPEFGVYISERVLASEYIFSPAEFVLPKIETQEELVEVAIRTYSSLRRSDKTFTVLLETPELQIQCSGNSIEFKRAQKNDVEYSYQLLGEGDDIELQLTEISAEDEKVVGCYEAKQLVSCLLLGFQTMYPNTPEFKHASWFIAHKDTILKEEALAPLIMRVQPRVISYNAQVKEYESFVRLWEMFKESSGYKILKVTSIVLASLMVLMVLWNIGTYVAKVFSPSNSKDKFPPFIIIRGEKFQVRPEVNGANVHFTVTPPIGSEIDVEEVTPILQNLVDITYGPKYSVGNVLGVLNQTGPDPDVRRAKKVKAKRIVRNSAKQGMLDDEGHTAVRNKIAASQVVIHYGNLRMYGLRWKEREIIFPAHIITGKTRQVTVFLPVSIGNNAYSMLSCQAYVYHLDFDNDIAVARIGDKSVPNSPDLTRYFHKEAHMPYISEGMIMKRNGRIDELSYFGKNVEYFTGNISIVRQNAKVTVDLPHVAAEFYMAQSCNIPTKAGDCGSPYVSLDKRCNTAMIIGLHTNLSIAGSKSWSNVISQEYLASINYTPEENIKQNANTKTAIPFDFSEIKHPSFKPLSKSWEFEEIYLDALDSLESETESDIFYDAEDNPDSNLVFIGREMKFKPPWIGKPSHKPTPWAEELEQYIQEEAPLITKEGYLSVTSLRNVQNINELKILAGKPSLIATQIDMFSDPIHYTPYLDQLLKETMPLYISKIDKDYGRKFRVLTDFEVINGLYTEADEWYGHLQPLDMDTSAGDYPRRFYNRTTKRPCFVKVNDNPRNEYWWADDDISQKIRASTLNTELCALEGINSIHLTTDAMKFELVGKPGKTRVFQYMGIQDVFLARKYYGALLSKVAEKHLEGTCSVGIDPVVGFHQLYQRFKKVSLFGEAGDFKRWDKHMMAEMCKAVILDIADRYIESNPEKAEGLKNVYNVLIDKVVYSVHTGEGHWYVKMRGNPSGNVLTSILNSFINLLMTYMGIVHIIKTHNQFIKGKTDKELLDKYGTQHRNQLNLMRQPIQRISAWLENNFDCAFYGDDKITAISPDYLWLINFMSFREFYTQIMGIDYDSPDKDGNYKIYDKIENLSYLSRSFTVRNGTVMPALKKATVNAFMYWARDLTTEQYKALFEVAIIEAALHSEEYYTQYRKVMLWIIEWLRRRGQILEITIPNYEQAVAETVNVIQHGRDSGALITHNAQTRDLGSRVKPTIVRAKTIIPLLSKATYKATSPERVPTSCESKKRKLQEDE